MDGRRRCHCATLSLKYELSSYADLILDRILLQSIKLYHRPLEKVSYFSLALNTFYRVKGKRGKDRETLIFYLQKTAHKASLRFCSMSSKNVVLRPVAEDIFVFLSGLFVKKITQRITD